MATSYVDQGRASIERSVGFSDRPFGAGPNYYSGQVANLYNNWLQSAAGQHAQTLDAPAAQARADREHQAAQARADREHQAAMQEQQAAAALRQQTAGITQGFQGSLIGEKNRSAALGETELTMDELNRLVKQGGVLSPDQIASQARRQTGQAGQQIAGAESSLRNELASSGITNPAAVAAAGAGLKSSTLGMGARIQSEGETANAMSLPGLLSQAGTLGMSRAGLHSATSYEQYQDRRHTPAGSAALSNIASIKLRSRNYKPGSYGAVQAARDIAYWQSQYDEAIKHPYENKSSYS